MAAGYRLGLGSQLGKAVELLACRTVSLEIQFMYAGEARRVHGTILINKMSGLIRVQQPEMQISGPCRAHAYGSTYGTEGCRHDVR